MRKDSSRRNGLEANRDQDIEIGEASADKEARLRVALAEQAAAARERARPASPIQSEVCDMVPGTLSDPDDLEDGDLADLADEEPVVEDDWTRAASRERVLAVSRPEVARLARASADAGLKALRKLSIARRKSKKRTLGPFLVVRPAYAPENRGAKIVIQDGRQQVTTSITPIVGLSEEDHEGALEELAVYVRRSVLHEKVAKDPEAIKLDRLFKTHYETLKPERGCAGYERKRESYRRDRIGNYWLMKFGEGKTVRFVDCDFGRNYKRWRLQQTARRQLRYERRDPTIEKEQAIADRAFKWLRKKLRKAGVPAPDLDFDKQAAPKKQKRSLTFTEYEWLLLACRGFQREGYSFKTKIEVRHGVAREVWDRLDDTKTKWLIRFFQIYFCTGTRFTRNKRLLWGVNGPTGSLDPDGKAIWRHGQSEELNGHKIAGRSLLVPVFAAIVRKWYQQDRKRAKRWGFDPLFVIHDGDGKPLKNIENLVIEVFQRAGLENSSHILKHTLVTLFALAGATGEEIAKQTNTDRSTLEKTYKWLPFFENDLERRSGRLEITRLIDLKRASPPAIAPEIAKEAVARLDGAPR